MAKKTVSKEKGKKGKTANKNAERESLAVELRDLIPQLDSEGLAFLVEQARVHLYNMQVEKLNKAAETANAASVRSKSLAGKSGSSRGASFRIDGTESGSSYYLHYGNNDVMFSRSEMTHLVKMVNAGGTSLETRERLFNWFDRERKDVFSVVPIADKFDDRLKSLVTLIKKSFKIRE